MGIYFIFQMGAGNDCCRIVVAVIFFAARMGLLGWSLLFLPLGFILIPALIINLISMCMLCGMKAKECSVGVNGRQLSKKERKRCCARAFYITQGIVLTILILVGAFAEDTSCMIPNNGYSWYSSSDCWN